MGMSFVKLPRSCSAGCSVARCSRWPSPPAAAPARARDGPAIVATTTQLGDMARNIAPGAKVTDAAAPNTDPHEYEVRPDDVKALASADIVLRSGGEVDEWLDGALDSAGVDEQDVVDAGAAAGLEGDDPHWWQDPRRAEKAAVAIGAALQRAGVPEDVGGVREAAAGARRGRRARAWTAFPPPQRLLVTSHDALGYYARRYGIAGRRHRDPGADDRRAAVRGRGRRARGDDQAHGREDDLRRELGQPEGRGGRSRARPARGSARSCGPTRSAPRAPTARPTSARSSPTRARWSHGFSGGAVDCRVDA